MTECEKSFSYKIFRNLLCRVCTMGRQNPEEVLLLRRHIRRRRIASLSQKYFQALV